MKNKQTIKDGDLTYRIIGCAMRVHTELGPGLREKPYENALSIELEDSDLKFEQQPTTGFSYLLQETSGWKLPA